MAALTSPQGTITFGYDALSRRTSMALPNGVVTTYAYDAASQLSSLFHQLSGSPIASFSYTYDRVGNRTSLTDLDGTHTYFYDTLNRLIQATHPQPTNPNEAFTYDPVGNRTASHLATGQVYDAANRLLEDSNFTYTYDPNGNLATKTSKITGEVTTYTYDAENQLVGVAKPGLVATYRYDALGRRIEKNVNGIIARYIYDNEDILLELDGANAVLARYTHGPGIDEPLAVARFGVGGGTFVFHPDGLGSNSTLTDLAGAPVRAYTYDSFGRIVAQAGALTNPYTYTAREFDPESGLFYYRARYYDPQSGRFLTEDPIGFLGNDVNLFAYVGNNPILLIDPLGTLSMKSFQQLRAASGILALASATAVLLGGPVTVPVAIGAAVVGSSGLITYLQSIRNLISLETGMAACVDLTAGIAEEITGTLLGPDAKKVGRLADQGITGLSLFTGVTGVVRNVSFRAAEGVLVVNENAVPPLLSFGARATLAVIKVNQ